MRSIKIVLLLLPVLTSSYHAKIGILSDDPNIVKIEKVWSIAQNSRTIISLDPVVYVTQWWGNMDAAKFVKAVCNLTKSGVDALVFLGPPRWNSLISSYSNNLGLPFISALEYNDQFGKYQVNMLPDTTEAAADFITHFNWNRFVFIYDSDIGPNQLQKILRLVLSEDFTPRVEAFWKASDPDHAFRYIHELLLPTSNRKIVLATSERFADNLVSNLARGESFELLLLTPVGAVQRFSSQGFYKLIKLSVIEPKEPVLQTLENRLKTIPSYSARGRTSKEVPDSVILHYDSGLTLNTMFNRIAQEIPFALKPQKSLNCLEISGEIPETVNYFKKTVVDNGATGRIKFNEDGQRTEFRINIMETTPFDIQKIGTWSDKSGLQIASEFTKDSTVLNYAAYRNDPPVRVTSILIKPFLLKNENGSFYGYIKDFLDELFDKLNLNYEINLVKDEYYGVQINGTWKGMIGELIRGEADIAVAPLTKTTEREKVVDFSKNLMTTGLNIMIKKPKSEMETVTFGPFSFLTVWSVETWMIILVAVVIFSATGYGISRFIGAPDRVRALETKGTDNLSPCGSVWFTVGSLFCRDTGIYPRNFTHRLWALLWWIFCIFISLMYVSMLTSTLIKARTTITTTHSRRTSQQVLKEFLENGVPTISLMRGGSTMHFFENSEIGLYQQYSRYLQEHPEIMVNTYSEGQQKIRQSEGDFAMIMESTTSKLLADTEPCDTLVTSGFLVTRNYGVALQKNSALKQIIDHAILSLMETGRLRNLYEKWWHNTTSTCEDPELNVLPRAYNNSMTLHEVSGVFYLFILFALISVGVAAVEYYVRTRNIRVE